jgi:hypothetical protein
MRYIVTVRGMRDSEEVYSCEGATVEEVSQSAIALATKPHTGFDPNSVEVVQVEEDIEKPHLRGYIAGLL